MILARQELPRFFSGRYFIMKRTFRSNPYRVVLDCPQAGFGIGCDITEDLRRCIREAGRSQGVISLQCLTMGSQVHPSSALRFRRRATGQLELAAGEASVGQEQVWVTAPSGEKRVRVLVKVWPHTARIATSRAAPWERSLTRVLPTGGTL